MESLLCCILVALFVRGRNIHWQEPRTSLADDLLKSSVERPSYINPSKQPINASNWCHQSQIPPPPQRSTERSSQLTRGPEAALLRGGTSKSGAGEKPPKTITCTGTTHSLSAPEVINTHCSASNCPVLASSSAADWCKAISLQAIHPFLFHLKTLTYITFLARPKPVVMQQGRSELQYSQPRFALLRLPHPRYKTPCQDKLDLAQVRLCESWAAGTFHSSLSSVKGTPQAQHDNKRREKGERLKPWRENWTPGERRTKPDKMQGK